MIQQLVTLFNSLPVTAQFLLMVAASLVVAKLVQIFSLKIVKRLIRKWRSDFADILYDHLHAPIYMSVALAGIYFSIVQAQLQSPAFIYLERIVLTLGLLIWAWAINRIGDNVLEFVKESEDSRFDYEFAPIFENFWTAIVLILLLFAVISGVWGINLTPLLASAGLLGVVVGYAAKDAIANFFGGIALYFDNTYKLGDYVVLDSGEEGIVVDIGIRATNVKTRDDVIITVPNSVLNSSRVTNESNPDSTIRLKVPVSVSYNADIDEVEDALLKVAEEEPSVIEHPKPRARFREFGDSGLQYELFAWIPNPIEKVRARHKLNQKVFKEFDKRGIEIPYPQRTVHMEKDARKRNDQNLSEGPN